MLKYSAPLDRIFYALSDPSRRSMIERLSKKEASVSDLAEPLDMSMAAVLQHVKVLEESGLISTYKAGRVRTCRVEPRSLELIESWLSQRKRFWEADLDRLGEFLEQSQNKKKQES